MMSELSKDSIINITLHGYSLALLLVLIMGMARRRPLHSRRLLMAAMQLLANAIIGALVSHIVRGCGIQGQVAHVALWLAVTGSYLFGVLTFAVIAVYACTDSEVFPTVVPSDSRLLTFQWVLTCFGIVAILTNPVTHILFFITPDNQLASGSCRWLVELVMAIQVIVVAIATLRMRGHGIPMLTRKLVVGGLLLLVGFLLSLVNPHISVIYPSIALLLTMLSVGVQTTLDEQLSRAQMDATESRVRLLSGQIHPHFIFNSLNAIKALIVEDPDLAEQAIQDFSDYLRSHLDVMSDSRLVPFKEEMEHVRHYVALEMADPSCPMDVSYDFETEDFLIPPLTVQPLVENAIRHGIRTHEGGGWVRVSTREFEDAIAVTVEGSGEGVSSVTERQSERRRVGFENVRERIERQCGGRIEKSFGEDGSVVVIMLPKGECA